MTVRLVVYLARAGVASRRGAGELVKEGRVKINGEAVTNPATGVDDEKDHVRVDGKMIKSLQPPAYLILNKPAGVLTTRNDPIGRPTVFDLLKRVKVRVEAVGRLDFDTEGLLLFTNDGALAQKLARPESKVEKVYEALVKGNVSRTAVRQLSEGIVIEGRKTLPARVKALGRAGENTELRIVIVEGRYHQVKLMCLAAGHPVKKLRRIAFGPLNLDNLPVGKFRYLTDREIQKLRGGGVRCAK